MLETLTYPQLLDKLEELVHMKRTGALYIQSNTCHLMTFALDNGRIFAIYYGGKRGRKALELIRTLSGGSCRFDSIGLGGNAQDLPETKEILELLREPVLAAPTNNTDTSSIAQSQVSAKNQEIMCRELKKLLGEFLGPIAGMVFDDVAGDEIDSCNTQEQACTLITKLVEEIDDSEEAEQFREQAGLVFEHLLGN